MKTLKCLFYPSILLLLFNSCSKDNGDSVQSEFPFTFTETHAEEVFINTPLETFFKITSEREVASNVYTLRYEVITGDGFFSDASGNVLATKTEIELSSTSPSFFFTATSIGEKRARVSVTNSSGVEQSLEVVYNVLHNPFSLTFSAPFTETRVKSKIPLTLNVFNEGEDKEIAYESAFFITKGSGSLKIRGSDQNIPTDQFQPITGTKNMELLFNDVGEASIQVTIRDSNGQIKSTTLDFTVNEIDVSYSATIQFNESFLGNENLILFSLSENEGIGGSYDIKYLVNEGNIKIFSNEQQINPGVFVDVPIGAFSWRAIAQESGPVDLSLVLRTESGVELTDRIEFFANENTLDLETSPQDETIFPDESTSISFSFVSSQETEGSYQMSYTVNTGNVSLSYENAPIIENNWFNLPFQNGSIDVLALDSGPVNITILLRDQFGTEINNDVSFEIKNPDFSFIILYEEEADHCNDADCPPIPIALSISPFSDSQSFQLEIKNIAGDYYLTDSEPLDMPQILWFYNAPQNKAQLNILPFLEKMNLGPGNIQLLWVPSMNQNDDFIAVKFTVTNNYGVEKTIDIQIDF